jgi:hypothetical protein
MHLIYYTLLVFYDSARHATKLHVAWLCIYYVAFFANILYMFIGAVSFGRVDSNEIRILSLLI